MALALSYGVNLAITLGSTILFQLFFFFVAYAKQFDKLTDLAGASNFLLNGLVIYFLQGTFFVKQTIAVSLLALWAIRLGGFLGYRVHVFGKDERFDEMRQHFWKFLGFWIAQIIWVWIVSLPITTINSSKQDPAKINALDIIGYALFAMGFLIESLADYQKFSFTILKKEGSANKDSDAPLTIFPFIQSGLWAYSRHPNYFGEICIWLGFWSLSITGYSPASTKIVLISVLSPLITFLLLAFVSGMSIAEASANKRYGHLQEYQLYRQRTSPMIPMPTGWYLACPASLKKTILMEWPIYRKNLQE